MSSPFRQQKVRDMVASYLYRSVSNFAFGTDYQPNAFGHGSFLFIQSAISAVRNAKVILLDGNFRK